jgi:hypothetical protein
MPSCFLPSRVGSSKRNKPNNDLIEYLGFSNPDIYILNKSLLRNIDRVIQDDFMPNLTLITFEVLLIIVIPLIILLLGGKWPLKTIILCLLLIPILWYLTYSPIHELSHALGTFLAGGKVTEYKLIPSFWEGVFAVAWIKYVGLNLRWQVLVMTCAPYVIDLFSIIIGGLVLQRYQSRSAFGVGLLFMLLSLRPTFDIACEAIGFYTGFRGDLWHIQQKMGSFILASFLILSLGLSLFFIFKITKRHKGFVEQNSVKE